MSVLPSLDPACEVLLSAARGNAPDTDRKCLALFSLIETSQTLSSWLRRELARSNLTENGFRLLAQVHQHETDGITSTEISTELHLPRQVISTTLGRLELSGLLTRERSSGDRRTLTLKLTAEGRRVFAAALQHCLHEINCIMSRLTPRDLDQLDQTCVQLRRLLAGHPPTAA